MSMPDVVKGDLLTGDFARKILAQTYIEQAGFTPEQLDQVIEALKSLITDELDVTERTQVWNGRSPYVGLNSFTEKNADLFFGRKQLIQIIVERLQAYPFVCVTGPSGSGKSSLIQAGVFKILQEEWLGSDAWQLIKATPRSNPFQSLAESLSSVSEQVVETGQIQDFTSLASLIQTLGQDNPNQRCLLFVDQFEELFTQTKDEGIRSAFADLLRQIATSTQSSVTIVLAVRSDFFSDCLMLSGYPELLRENLELVGSMTVQGLTEAIMRPAYAVGASLETALVAQLIDDIRGDPGALPLLQFTLDRLFRLTSMDRKGQQVQLTLADYEAQGSLDQLLAVHADRVLKEVKETILQQYDGVEGDDILAFIFTQLIEVGQGRADTRRVAEFEDLVPHAYNPALIARVVTELSSNKARLVTIGTLTTPEEFTGIEPGHTLLIDKTVTLAHEMLIGYWPWLRNLIDRMRSAIVLQDEIRTAAAKWIEHKRNESYTYIGAQLAVTLEQIEEVGIPLNKAGQAFIKASKAQQKVIDDERAAVEQARELARQQELQYARAQEDQARKLANEERQRREVEEQAKEDAQLANKQLRRREKIIIATAIVGVILAIATALYWQLLLEQNGEFVGERARGFASLANDQKTSDPLIAIHALKEGFPTVDTYHPYVHEVEFESSQAIRYSLENWHWDFTLSPDAAALTSRQFSFTPHQIALGSDALYVVATSGISPTVQTFDDLPFSEREKIDCVVTRPQHDQVALCIDKNLYLHTWSSGSERLHHIAQFDHAGFTPLFSQSGEKLLSWQKGEASISLWQNINEATEKSIDYQKIESPHPIRAADWSMRDDVFITASPNIGHIWLMGELTMPISISIGSGLPGIKFINEEQFITCRVNLSKMTQAKIYLLCGQLMERWPTQCRTGRIWCKT